LVLSDVLNVRIVCDLSELLCWKNGLFAAIKLLARTEEKALHTTYHFAV
jgi:hypothetical protein